MHPRTVIQCNWFGHHCCYHVMLFCNVLDNVLVTLDRIGSINKTIVTNVYFALSSSRNFMMMGIANYSEIRTENVDTFMPIVHKSISRWTWKISLSQPESITNVFCLPGCFTGSYFIALTMK